MAKGKETAPRVTEIPEGFTERTFAWWIPEKSGDSLCGTYVESFTFKAKHSKEESTGYTIAEMESGEALSVAGRALDRHFKSIDTGTEVFIRFDGIEDIGNGRKMKRFTVATRGGSSSGARRRK